ncbi:titin-like isoform X4 [Juglans regia]|uniref:Titin-like isoform X4 n=1 Tax=Juglans regia TaxID=51240 RepID=A0A6P9ELW3_JUGRE|nr:titin-like isoform X4 [Juglans regia]
MVLSEDEEQLQEGERSETGEETGREVKDKMPRSNDTEEGLLEDDTTKVYSTVHTGEKIVKPSFQVESPEEAASKSSGEDERNNTTVEEPHLSKQVHDGHGIQAIPREQIAEANVVFVTPKPIEEEMTKNHQDKENKTKNSREEDGCLKSIKEGNVNDLSQESIGVGPNQNFEDDKKETTNLSKGETFYEQQTASVRACERIALGTIHNPESLENIPGASKQEEGLQGDSEYLAPTEASANDEDKNASSAQVAEDTNDNRLAETTENSAKVIPQGEEDLQQGLQINESPENILGASLVKRKEGQQGEVENQHSTESSIENRDEVTSSIKNTEIGARVIGGEEETDHTLKNDEPGETDCEVESPGEVLDTAKQGNGLQGDDDNLVPPETSINKRDELTSSVKTFGDNHENNRLAEATENSAKTTPEGEDSEPPLQRDETGESIALETAHGVEIPKNISDLALVKQDKGLQEECEKITPPEAEIEKRHEDTSYNSLSEATENSVKATPEGQEDSEHALHKHETRESIALETNHGVGNPKNIPESALVKQEEVLQGEVENQYSTESSIENRDKETSSIKVAEDNDKNNRPVETTENHARVIQQGEEERDQVLPNDEPGETDREVESPGEVLDTVKQGNGLQGDDEKVVPPETSINKRDELISSVGMYGDNHENNRLEGEDSEPPLQRDETGESIALETAHGVEIPKNIPDLALVKQDKGLQAECEELASTEAEIEKGDGDTSYVKVTEDNYANNKLVEATVNSTKTTPEGEEDPETSIVLETAHGVEIPKNIPDLALVKQEEGLQAECEKIALPEAEIEKQHEDTSCVKVDEDKDVNNSLAEATENSAKATPEGQEDSEHALHEHETRESIALETYHGVESPKNIPDTALVKQEEVLQGEVENQYSTVSSTENRDEEMSSIKVAKDNDENNRPAETTENHARVVQQGDEETDHVLQNDESGETNCEAFQEILDTVKQGNYLQGDDDNLVPETSINKKDELTSSVEVFGDKTENNGQAEATENSAKTTPESEEDSGHALQRDETGESIAHEANHGVEGPKNTPDPALVKQEEGLQAECEKLAPTEAEIEKRQGDISYFKVAEDNNANNKLAEDTERNTKILSESGEDSYKVLLTDEPGQTIRGLTNHNVKSPENNLDSLLVKQGEGMQGESDNLGQTKTSIKVAEDEDNIGPVETTKNSIKVILKGEEDSEHVLQKDDPQQKPIQERNPDVEKPEENLDKSLVNQEEDLQVEGENLAPTEASMENKDEDIPPVKMVGHKAENNMQDEDRENSPKGTPKVEDSEHSLSKDAREIIGCEADREIEGLEKFDNSPLVNQEVFLQREGENLISKEASVERRDENTSYMKIAKGNDNDDNDGLAAEAADISVKATSKGEENLEEVIQKDEPGKQPEQLLDVVSEDKEAEYILEKMENTTLVKEEGIIQNLEETSEVEKKEETKTVDDKKEKEAAIEKVFNTTSFSEETGVQMAEEIHNVRDLSPEFNEKEITKENFIEEQQCGALETVASSTNTEKSVIDKPATAELPSSSDKKETVKESLKEEESDVMVLKEEAGGTTLEFIKQTDLTEKAKAETLQDCAGQSRDFTALTTIENYFFMPEVPVEEINEKLLKQEKNTIIDSDSASEAVVSELGLKETKPDNKEHVKSFDIVPEEKGLATIETGVSLDSVDIEVQSEENSKSEENMSKKIFTVADETGEKIEHQMEDKASTGGIDNELSLTSRETTLDGISEDGSRDSYIMPLQEHEPTTTEVGKIMEETSARDEIIDEIAKIPSSVQKTDEKLIQKEDESINPADASELLSSDDGKDGAIEELKHEDAELHMPPKQHIEKNSYETEDVEISKRGETSALADQTEVCKLESLEVENPSDDPSKPIAVGPYQGSDKTILEQGDFVQTEGILTGVLVEKGTTGKKTNVCSHECEPTNTKTNELLAEKNLESDDLRQKLVFGTESEAKDPSHETLPQTNKSQTEENSNDVQDWNFESVEPQITPQVQGKTETKMAMETKLKAEDHINVSPTTKETITTHTVTEGVHERIQEVDGSEGIKEQAIHGESELKKTHKVSAEDYAFEKVEDCGTKSTDYLEATDSSEQTETVKADIQEATRETETSGTKALKEEKIQDEFSLKPEDITTTVVEDSEEKIKVEVDHFLEHNDNATVVPAESIVGEVPMDDKAIKETSLDERLETITIQSRPQAEEAGSKKLRMEGVDGSESIKERAIQQESQLKEIYEVSTEDDTLEKVEDCGTKSSDYLEATDPNKHTETVQEDIQEPTRETEAPGTKAPEEEKIQDEVRLKPVDVSKTEAEDTEETIKEKIEVEADNFLDENDNATMVPTESPIRETHMDDNSNESLETITIQPCPQAEEPGSKKLRIEEVDGSEGIKEQVIHGESELKEIQKVYAEEDILKKVEDCGTKSSDYLEETDSSEHTETLTADIQEPTRETKASGTKVPEEEKIQDEVSLKPVEISITEAEDKKEMIKEEIQVEAKNLLGEDGNAIAVPAESPIPEAHMDDKVVKETSSDESVETITIQHCPQAEEVGSKKLQIEEVEGSEGIKKDAIHGESELKEIHKVYAEDDILEKVEDSDYLKETDSREQTKTLTADIQEPTRETKASGTKAPEEEKIQDEVSLKPVEISTTEAENKKETIKEEIQVEADNLLGEDGNATAVPAESPIPEAHMDDKAVKKTTSDESVETITIQPCPQAEEVGSKKLQIEEVEGSEDIKRDAEEVDGSEDIKKYAIHEESELKEIHKVYAEDDILEKVEDSDYLEETDSREQTETLTANSQEPTRETEASGTKAPEEEKIQDEVSLKPVEISTTEAEDKKETIKEEIQVEADNLLEEDDNATAVPAESPIPEAHMDDKAIKETRSDESVETITIQPCPYAEEVGSKKLRIEEVDGSEGTKEKAIYGESELKEIHKVSAKDDIVQKVEDSRTKSSTYLEETDFSEQTETLTENIQETTRETKASGTKAPEEEKIQDEVSLKPVDVSTTEAEDTEETIKEKIKVEVDNILDEDDNVTVVPAESPIHEAHMDGKSIKETSPDESLETVTFQPCLQAEDVGSKKLPIEEVDGTEGIKEQAMHGEHGLKEIHRVSAKDDILQKVEDCGTKSSDYLEAIESSEQTVTVKANVQEPTMETELSGPKAPKEENIQDEVSLKPANVSTREAEDAEEKIKEYIEVEADNFLDEDDNATAVPTKSPKREAHKDDKTVKETSSDESVEIITIQPCPHAEEVGSKKLQIEEVDGSESIKEQAIHAESELKEIHKVSAKDDIVEKVDDCGTKSFDYLEETDSSDQTETVKAFIQEQTRETEAFGAEAPEEEKIQNKVSLKTVDVSETEVKDTKEAIKVKIKVEANNLFDEDDNATAVPAELPIREAHMDDKSVKETSSDESVETITIQPCPQAEEVGSKKLKIEEVDGSEGIKEQAIHGASELKEIHKVYAEDDILEKVEDCGRKSSDYLEEIDSSEQIETLTADIQEPTRETEASGTKAPEEEKIQDEISLKPVEISTTEAEDTKEMIKEKIKVETDNFLDEDDNATAIPVESPIPEVHMDDKAIEEIRSDDSVETIRIQPCPQAEEVGSKKLRIGEVDGSEGTKEKAISGESELKEIHKVSTKDDIVEKVEDSGTKSSTYQEETDFSEQTETLTANIQETTRETKASGTKAPEEEKIQDEVSLKPVDVSTTEAEDTGETIKEKIKVEADNILYEDDNAIAVPVESPVCEAHTDDKAVNETCPDESLETVKIQPCPQVEDVGSKKLPIEEVDGTEGIKEQAMHGEQEFKEIHRVSAEDDILQKVEDSGRKSSDYQEETDSNEQTETLTTDIQEPTRETEASGKKASEEEKIQDEVDSLKPIEISTREAEDTKETIKEKIKVEADNFLDEDDNATAVPAKSPKPKAHMDDKAIKETRSEESVETITTQPCPHAEEVGNKKLRIEEVDGSEGTKEKAIYGERELKEIHKVSTKDDIVEKVEDSGTKSSTYLGETNFSEQIETLTTNIQETTSETEASGTKAPEEENIQDEVSLKPVDVSTTEVEDKEEMNKEKIKVEADNILDEDDNAIGVPAESPVREAHSDDKVDKETSLDESLKTVTIHPCPQAEDVGSKKLPIEEVDGTEGIKEQAMHGEQELKEIYRVSAEDDILQKVEDCGRKSSDYQEETDSNEQTKTLTTDIQEPTRETEASGKKAPEEEKIQDDVSLKPVEISTREAEDTKEMIKEKIKAEADNFLDEDDYATAIPAESPIPEAPIPEAHMDDKAIKETRLDESVETITTQPCPHAEEVGNKKHRIEEVDGSEGTKEKTIYGESELKEIHKVSTKDDIVEKVEDSGTKSSTYLEETDFSEQTETLTTNIQETTRETEASGTKAPEEEKIHDEVSLKPVDVSTTEAEDTEETIKEKIKVEADNILDEDDNAIAVPAESPVLEAHTDDKVDKETSLDESLETVTIHPCPQAEDVGSKKHPIEEVDGSEGIKEQAMHGEQELKEIHRVSAEDDILQKEEDCGRKSSDYQEETDSNEQTETLTTDIQEPTRETEASGKKAPEEEKIQDEMDSLKPIEISTREAKDTKETIKEKIKVEADNFHDEDDNATAVPAESPKPEAHMDDKAIKDTRSDESVETITTQPCPHAEEVGNKKLRIEEVDGSEGTKEKAIYGESELKEIHKVSTKDDIVGKVEDSGTKSSTYLEETDFSEQTETLTTNIQETTRETEASGTKAPEEEKIHDEVSLKPVDVSTTEAEDTEETIKEKIKVEADNILDEDDNAIAVPAESPVREAHTDDKVDKETSLDESLETVTIHPCPQAEDVGSKKLPIEEVDGSEGIKEQAMHGEQELKEIHRVSAEDDILQKEEDCGRKSSDYQEETDSNEQTETLTTDIQEPTRETEASGKKAPEEEKIQDKVSLKPVEISTREAEDTKEMIKENIKVEADNFLDEDDNATAVPAESPIPEAHMDDKAIKETRSDDSIETITIQPCPHAEEVGSKKLRIEEVDGSEGTKEKAIYGESELKEIHKVSTKDDIVEKVEDSGTKSSTYLEETDFSEQTETLTTNIQETTRETEASGTKAPEEEKIHDEVSLKPVDVSTTEAEDTEETIKEKIKVEADNILDEDDNAIAVPAESPVREAHTDDKVDKETSLDESLETVTIHPCPQAEDVGSKKLPIEEVDGSEGIKEQAMHGEQELKEIHRVSAEDDILQKEEDCGRKSSDYQEETDSNEQTETLTTDIQEPTRETEASGKKAPEEEKIQDKVSLKPVEISTREAEDTKEMIKENIKVEADNFLDEDDNATAVPAESPIPEAHMDDKAIKETRSDDSIETITIQPCPHAEEVGSKKLRIEEVDGSEGTKEKAIYGESELKEIHKVSTKDDIVEKVEDSGTKSSTYLEETDFSEQTETLTTNIQETTRETEASGTKAPEEEKIHDEVSLKPVDVSTTEAEDTEETIKEKIKVEADNILDEDDNAIVVPAESPVCEAHTDDKAVNETCPNKSLETVTIQPCPQVEDVDSKKLPIEEVDGSEGIKGLAMHGERELKEIHRVSAEDDILQKVEDCGTKSSNYLEATDPSEQTATVKANIQEQTVETELSGTKALEEENIQDEVSLKPANLSTREAKDAEEKIKEYTEVEADKFLDENDNASAVPAESCMGEAHMDLEAVKEISSDESLEIITIENIRLEQDEPMVHKNEEKESVTQGKPGADEVEDVKTSPSAVVSSKYLGVEETQETGQSLRVEKLDSDRSEEGIKEDSGTMSEAKSLGIEMVTQGEMTSGQTLPTGNLEEEFQTPSSALLSLEREHGPTTVVKEAEATKIMEEEIINDSLATKATEETCLQNKEQLQTLSSALLSKEQEHEAQTAFKKTEEESTKEVESLDDKNINNFSAIKESEETGLEQEGPMDPEHVEKESATLEKQDTDEVEVTKTVSREQEHGTTTAGERTEEEEMKGAKMIGDESIDNSSAAKTTEGTCLKTKEHMELEVSTLGLESSKATHRGSSNEVQEEEGSKLDQASKLEPHEKEEMKYDDSPSGVQSHQVLPKSEDMKEKHLETAMTDLNAEESQCKETAEEDQIFKNRVSMEEVREVVEEKEVAKDSQSVSPGDETIIESHQGDELKAVACPEEETNKTFKATTNANQHEALKLPELIDKDSASENIEKKITAEESSYLNEAEGKNIEEAVSELDLDYKSGETHITKEKTEVIALSEKEAGVEISQKEGTAGFSEVNEITEDIQQLEKNSYAASEIKIPGEEEPSGNKEAAFITDNEDVLPVLQHPIDKALQKVELEHERPGKATEVDAEERGIECEGEKRMGGSGEINKESASVDSAKMSSSDLMQGSMKKNLQAAKNLTKEREPMPSKAKIQNEGAETTQIDKARADEEEGDEHKRSEPDSDSPVMVEASKDTEAKVPHKKSHNILSGVGSKVKHSISKVKKAITGKSSHPKTSLPK